MSRSRSFILSKGDVKECFIFSSARMDCEGFVMWLNFTDTPCNLSPYPYKLWVLFICKLFVKFNEIWLKCANRLQGSLIVKKFGLDLDNSIYLLPSSLSHNFHPSYFSIKQEEEGGPPPLALLQNNFIDMIKFSTL